MIRRLVLCDLQQPPVSPDLKQHTKPKIAHAADDSSIHRFRQSTRCMRHVLFSARRTNANTTKQMQASRTLWEPPTKNILAVYAAQWKGARHCDPHASLCVNRRKSSWHCSHTSHVSSRQSLRLRQQPELSTTCCCVEETNKQH